MKRSGRHSMMLCAGACLAIWALAGCQSDVSSQSKAAQEQAIQNAIHNPSAKKRAAMAKMDAFLKSQQGTGKAPAMPNMNSAQQ